MKPTQDQTSNHLDNAEESCRKIPILKTVSKDIHFLTAKSNIHSLSPSSDTAKQLTNSTNLDGISTINKSQISPSHSKNSLHTKESNPHTHPFVPLKQKILLEKLFDVGCYLRKNNSNFKDCQLLSSAMSTFKLYYHYTWKKNSSTNLIQCSLFIFDLLISSAENKVKLNAKIKACQIAICKLTKPYLKIVSQEGHLDELISSDIPIDNIHSDDKTSLKQHLQADEISVQTELKVMKLGKFEESKRIDDIQMVSHLSSHLGNDSNVHETILIRKDSSGEEKMKKDNIDNAEESCRKIPILKTVSNDIHFLTTKSNIHSLSPSSDIAKQLSNSTNLDGISTINKSQVSPSHSKNSLHIIESNPHTHPFVPLKQKILLEKLFDVGCYLKNNNSNFKNYQLLSSAMSTFKLCYHYTWKKNSRTNLIQCSLFTSDLLISSAENKVKLNAKIKACQIAICKLTKPYFKIVSQEGHLDELISSDIPIDNIHSDDKTSLKRLLQADDISVQPEPKVMKLGKFEESKRIDDIQMVSHLSPHLDNDSIVRETILITKDSNGEEIYMLSPKKKDNIDDGTHTSKQLQMIKTGKLDEFVIFEEINYKNLQPYTILNRSALFNGVTLTPKFIEEKKDSCNQHRCFLFIDAELLSEGTGDTTFKAQHSAAILAMKKLKECRPIIRVKGNNDSRIVTRVELFGDQNKIDECIPDNNIGNKLLRKMGWTGGALGKNGNNGIEVPIQYSSKNINREGLGLNTKANLDGKMYAIFRPLIQQFARNLHQDELRFDCCFSKEERAIIHKICHGLNLKSVSQGKDNNRFLVVRHKQKRQQLLKNSIYLGSSSKYELIQPTNEQSWY